MKTKRNIKHSLLIFALAVLGTLSASAQQINLDKVVRAAELTLFQELNNDKAWYYIIDKPKIATD
ncbi:MAG: hypothetical protein KDD04_04830, partial [Sinomicrobium sp.]|nr:hypothetical protein [Sinomicrobium sp.]